MDLVAHRFIVIALHGYALIAIGTGNFKPLNADVVSAVNRRSTAKMDGIPSRRCYLGAVGRGTGGNQYDLLRRTSRPGGGNILVVGSAGHSDCDAACPQGGSAKSVLDRLPGTSLGTVVGITACGSHEELVLGGCAQGEKEKEHAAPQTFGNPGLGTFHKLTSLGRGGGRPAGEFRATLRQATISADMPCQIVVPPILWFERLYR